MEMHLGYPEGLPAKGGVSPLPWAPLSPTEAVGVRGLFSHIQLFSSCTVSADLFIVNIGFHCQGTHIIYELSGICVFAVKDLRAF